jgi:hypothetical protein
MTADITALTSDALWWEIAGYVATGIVAIGVAGELAALVIRSRSRKRLIDKVSLYILLAGLAGEILSQVQSNNKNALIVGLLNQQTEQLKLAVATADKTASEAKAQAANAEIELQRLKTPRVFESEDFEKELKGKPTAKGEIMYAKECSDCLWLSQLISIDMEDADWEMSHTPPQPLPPSTSEFPAAIEAGGLSWGISVVSSSLSADTPAQLALAGALSRVLGTRVYLGRNTRMPGDVVRVVVPPRP